MGWRHQHSEIIQLRKIYVLSPLCGMETLLCPSAFWVVRTCFKPTVWDGDILFILSKGISKPSSKPTVWDGDNCIFLQCSQYLQSSKPTAWDGDAISLTFSSTNEGVLSPLCGMETTRSCPLASHPSLIVLSPLCGIRSLPLFGNLTAT